VLSASVTSLKTKNAAMLLFTAIANKNVDGQVLAGNHCLCFLCELFSLATLNGGTELDWIDNIDGSSRQMLSHIIRVLCACISNPHDDENKSLCARLMPHILHLIDGCIDVDVEFLPQATLLLNCLLEDNLQNKEIAIQANGLDVLLTCLRKVEGSALVRRVHLAICHNATVDA